MAKNEVAKNNYLYTSLKELGLTDLETNLYTLSLKLGPSSISNIAQHLNVSRPNVYKVIEGLQKYGLASFYGKEKYARSFLVESPSVVLEKLRSKKDSLVHLDNMFVQEMPDLLALYQQAGKDTKIKILNTREQYVKVFLQTAEEATENSAIEFFGSADDFIALTGWDTEKKWVDLRLKKKIGVKSLVPGSSLPTLEKNRERELREVRVYTGELPFKTAFELFGNKMILWQPKAPLAILVEDEYLVEMFRSIFYVLWGLAGTDSKNLSLQER